MMDGHTLSYARGRRGAVVGSFAAPLVLLLAPRTNFMLRLEVQEFSATMKLD